ncbi:hypothetical protein SCH4B_4820 [Ruegeria sp. TrichCH4B]|nr:hypothetical protein SCH4B_4820 [Ruegeria sp. TrichCH4B]
MGGAGSALSPSCRPVAKKYATPAPPRARAAASAPTPRLLPRRLDLPRWLN